MMRLMADKHGWSIEGQARPTGPDALPSASPTAPLPAPHTPAYTDPGMSHSSRAPAALGAPLGEESFPPMGPPPLPVREREYVDPLSALTESDWSSLPGSSATEADVWSVTSAAPPLKRKPHPGIPLTADFKAEYDRIASEYAPMLDASGLRRFSYSSPKIQRSISPRSFYLRRLSPWAITPGEGACSVTGLTRRIRDGLTWRYSPEPLCALPRMRGHLRT